MGEGLAFPSPALERGMGAWQGAARLSGMPCVTLSVPKIRIRTGDVPALAPTRPPGSPALSFPPVTGIYASETGSRRER